MTLFFGYAFYKLKGLGNLPQASGIMHIVLGAMMISIIFTIVAGSASILAQGINVAIILRAIEVIKKQVSLYAFLYPIEGLPYYGDSKPLETK